MAPGVDMTDALYALPDQAATQRGAPNPRVLSASLGISEAFSSPILTSSGRPLETPFTHEAFIEFSRAGMILV